MSITVRFANRQYVISPKYQGSGIFREDGAEQCTRIGYVMTAQFRNGRVNYPDPGFEPKFFATKKEALTEKVRMKK